MALFEGLILAATVLYLLYKYGTATFSYWSEKGVYQMDAYPFFGSSLKEILGMRSQLDSGIHLYESMKGRRYGGVYFLRQPSLIIVDPELVKQVMIKDFEHFSNRSNFIDAEADPLFGRTLFALRDQTWKDMRNTLTPAFTASKMKHMISLIEECAEQFSKHIKGKIDEQIKNGKGDIWTTDIKLDLYTRFTNDVTASTAFGLKVDSLENPNNEFYLFIKKITDFTGWRFLKFFFIFAFPALVKKFKISLFGEEANRFFNTLVVDTMKERVERKIYRPDMIQLLIQARQGTLHETESDVLPVKHIELSDQDATSQAMFFIFAGFETSATLISFASHEIAVNQEVEKKLQEEIDRVLAEDGGKITYDGVMHKMTYLDMVISETLRKWPPVPVIDRNVTKTYVIPGNDKESDLQLEPDDIVNIPVIGLQMDPEYFPDPKVFDPERFSEENKSKIVQGTYLPFGIGPRSCIGNRYALMVAKICLVNIFRNFTLVPVKETQEPIILKKASFTNIPEKGFILGIKNRY